MARKFSSGGVMPPRGRIPPFLVISVLAFMFIGLVGFQIVKERRVAVAAFHDKATQLEGLENSLKEQIEARDFMKTKLTEFERVSKSSQEVLRTKDQELDNLKKEHAKTVQELEQLKRVVVQKEGEIVYVREQLQKYSFEKAKQSAEEINKQQVSVAEEERQEEFKHADEAGLDDRNRIQEEEDSQVAKETEHLSDIEHVSATEQEMFERNQRQDETGKLSVEETVDSGGDEKTVESVKVDTLQDEEAEEQDIADTRDPIEVNDGAQDKDLSEETKHVADSFSHDHKENESHVHGAE